MKRFVSLFLALCLMASLGVAASAAGGLANLTPAHTYRENQFTDIPRGFWCEKNVAKVYELGLMLGNTTTTFNPYGNVTEAQALVIAARIHKLYYTGDDDFAAVKEEMLAQYEPAVLEWCGGDKSSLAYREFTEGWYAAHAYYLHKADPDNYPEFPALSSPPDQALFISSGPISRLDFARYLAHALPAEELAAINTVDPGAIPDVTSDEDIYRLYRAGVVIGSDAKGTFYPESSITRGAASAIIGRLVDPTLRQSVTLTKTASASITVYADDPIEMTYPSAVPIQAQVLDASLYPEGISLNANYNGEVVETYWGDWDGSMIHLKLIPVANGTTTITISAAEDPSVSVSFTVVVSGLDADMDAVPYGRLAREAHALLYQHLLLPNSLEIYRVCGGEALFDSGRTKEVVYIDFSAKSFDGQRYRQGIAVYPSGEDGYIDYRYLEVGETPSYVGEVTEIDIWSLY